MPTLTLYRRDKTIAGVATIDHIDARQAQHRWYLSSEGYVRRHISGGDHLYLHNAILTPPVGMQVDHIDGNKLNNRRSNLRVIPAIAQQQNRASWGASGHRGVCFDKARGTWEARVTIGGLRKFIGRFASAEEASVAASNYRREHMPYANEARH